MNRPATDIVGIQEIAVRLGYRPETVNSWRKRARTLTQAVPFPDPEGTIGNTPWWHWMTVAAWAEETGR